ncbi:MAG: molybdopterin biosynthesis protein, partial [Alphaproteobacteria bacterium]|nr:molybdopterin biosynthesis protein [Alphaproteobacteria bacterium]
MSGRNIYLENVDIEEAVQTYLKALEPAMDLVEKEKVPTHQSLGRVLAEPLFAVASSPSYNGAAMDGIMVRSEATKGATDTKPLTLVRGKDFEEINTGFPLKDPFDAVIMIEDLVYPQGEEGEPVVIKEAAFPWQHVRAVGEDIVAGEM